MRKEDKVMSEQPEQPEKEAWYKKQFKDPTGMKEPEVSGKTLGGCLAGILLIVIVIFAIAGSQ